MEGTLMPLSTAQINASLIARQVDLDETVNELLVELARRSGQRPGDFLEQLVKSAVKERASKEELVLNGSSH
jgi:hypothetical protein